MWRGDQPNGSVPFVDFVISKLQEVMTKAPVISSQSSGARTLTSAVVSSLVVVTVVAVTQRVLLKQLLSYHRWLNEGRGKTSTKTKIWGLLLSKCFAKWQQTFAYQDVLPRLPVPSVEDTIRRYLLSMEPLLSGTDHAKLKAKASEFLASGEAKQCQQVVLNEYNAKPNYVDDWWLEFAYLRPRDSIMINSNYYAFTLDMEPPTTRPASRAAYYLHSWVRLVEHIHQERGFNPQMMQGMVPFCMHQYRKVLSLTRVPKKEKDELVSYRTGGPDSRHVAVFRKGRLFKVDIYCPSHQPGVIHLAAASQIEAAFDKILSEVDNDDDKLSYEEIHLPNLTGWDRGKWADVREDMLLTNDTNRETLAMIESAIMVVVFDEDKTQWDDLSALGGHILHGNSGKHARWYDKSVTMVMNDNCTMGFNCEHSFADAPMVAHYIDELMAHECEEPPYERALGGRVSAKLGVVTPTAPTVKRYRFDVSRGPLQQAIKLADTYVKGAGDDLELCITRFKDFGKNAVARTFKLSPDAFIQIALQTAYFRIHGEFTQTYESATMRLYLLGRTETIRSATNESAAFVRELCSSSTPDKKKCIELFRKASDCHSSNTCVAMTGGGVDRHLFALYVASNAAISGGSSFLREAIRRGYKLSTSQVPIGQSDKWKSKTAVEKFPRANGGFGPVHPEGYGISYVVAGDNSFTIHVSSFRSCKETSSKRMLDEIVKALREFQELFN